ncbi:MAG TPA: thioredoxin domain-containing protein [Thermoanaerobaculia bacterium]
MTPATPVHCAGVANRWKETEMKKSLLTVLVLLVAVPLFAGSAKNTAGKQAPATIGNVTVTEEELDRAVGTKLTRLMTDVYNVRRTVLEELIGTKLLESEAARRKITVDELLKIEVADKVTVPDTSEIEKVFEGVAERFPGMTREQALAEITHATRETRTRNRKAEFIRELREGAGVKINLAPPRVAVKAEGPSRGNPNAPVTIVEFSDFECQFCGRAVETLRKVEEKYGDQVRIVFRDYPLPMHRTAKRAAEAAHCANEQQKFWEMHDKLFSKTGPISDSDVFKYAGQIGLDHDRFNSCMSEGKYAEAWKPAMDEGSAVGVQSTPTFFINGRLIVGAASLDAFSRVIDEELAHVKTADQQRTVTKVVAGRR